MIVPSKGRLMTDVYENPLCTRYASDEMKKIFSADTKFSTWRKLWVALAESEKELGINITDEQIKELTNIARLGINVKTNEAKLSSVFEEIGYMFYEAQSTGADHTSDIASLIMKADKSHCWHSNKKPACKRCLCSDHQQLSDSNPK